MARCRKHGLTEFAVYRGPAQVHKRCLKCKSEKRKADPAGMATTEALQRLKKNGEVVLEGGRWWLPSEVTCPRCRGKGRVPA